MPQAYGNRVLLPQKRWFTALRSEGTTSATLNEPQSEEKRSAHARSKAALPAISSSQNSGRHVAPVVQLQGRNSLTCTTLHLLKDKNRIIILRTPLWPMIDHDFLGSMIKDVLMFWRIEMISFQLRFSLKVKSPSALTGWCLNGDMLV